ncbi:MAG TPA: TlpA disulfide reductase family protein [Bryobacteraceae bacterium]|nr:TlpA disulfide reductase family protein [Bryobacteraceae bacterium]
MVFENFGASRLADRYGLKGYPAIFVDEVLVASPREFGSFGDKPDTGRYSPWTDAGNQEKFKQDLANMIDLILAGRKNVVRQEHPVLADAFHEISSLPKFKLTDLSGKAIDASSLAGKPVLIEFWATWCVPCRSTLEWLGELKRKYGDSLAIVALAVESQEPDVRKIAGGLSQELTWGTAGPEIAQMFGDITAVPTMFLFDKNGQTGKVLYGAPPDLHESAEKVVRELMR